MFELIVTIIFVLSLCGIFVIVFRKVPVLATLPKNGTTGFKKHRVILNIEKRIKEAHFDLFVKQLLLHKTLSWVKVMTLKIETKLDTVLHRIRKKAQEIDKQAANKK